MEGIANPDRSVGRRTARFWKPLEIAAGCIALVLWFGAMSLWMYYDSTRPTTPDRDTGRIYAQNTHGSVVYLTRTEETTVLMLIWGGAVLFVVAVAIDMSVRRFQRKDSRV